MFAEAINIQRRQLGGNLQKFISEMQGTKAAVKPVTQNNLKHKSYRISLRSLLDRNVQARDHVQ